MEGIKLSQKGYPFEFYPEYCPECKGKCCTNSKPSYLWVTQKDISAISSLLKITETEFKLQYLNRINGRHNLKDIKINGIYQCAFLDAETGKCSIYQVRPEQCITYPFWQENLEDIDELSKECPGVKLKTESPS